MKLPDSHLNLLLLSFIPILICTIPFSYSGERSDAAEFPNRVGETLVAIRSGESSKGTISYGLYYVASASRAASNAPAGSDLVLILRNNGAKWIDLTDATVENFSLHDSIGKKIELHMRSQLRGIGYGQSEVIHFDVRNPVDAPEPWTFSFESPDTFVRVDFSISGIRINKPVQADDGQKHSH